MSIAGGNINKLEVSLKDKERIIYKFYPTEERAKLAYKLGEIDYLKGVFNPTPFQNWQNSKVQEVVDQNREVVLFFNTQDKFLSDKNLRQALSYGIDKDELPGKRALSPISPLSWAYNPQVKPYHYDLDRAKELLEEMPDELKDNLTINLVTSPILLNIAEKIASDWKEVGITSALQVTSGVPSDNQVLLAIYEVPKDPDQYSIWHSTQEGSNITKFHDARIDSLLESGRGALSFCQREIYPEY